MCITCASADFAWNSVAASAQLLRFGRGGAAGAWLRLHLERTDVAHHAARFWSWFPTLVGRQRFTVRNDAVCFRDLVDGDAVIHVGATETPFDAGAFIDCTALAFAFGLRAREIAAARFETEGREVRALPMSKRR